jgi:hypothetical protein
MSGLTQYVGGAIAATAFITIGSLVSQSDVTAAPPTKPSSGRSYYLTQSGFTGGQVLNACAAGYHTASWIELSDLSNLSYNTTLGPTTVDSGFGPPGHLPGLGWVRTSHTSFNHEGVGSNCAVDENAAWVSSDAAHYGTVMTFAVGVAQGSEPHLQYVQNGRVFLPRQCSVAHPVWCVQD